MVREGIVYASDSRSNKDGSDRIKVKTDTMKDSWENSSRENSKIECVEGRRILSG